VNDNPPFYPFAIGECFFCRSEMVVSYHQIHLPELLIFPTNKECQNSNIKIHAFTRETLRYPPKGCIVVWQEEACD